MSSLASFKGHPLHAMLIPLPIGLWSFSLVSDILFKRGWGGAVWNDVAFYTIAGGIVGTVIAALPGFVDLTDMSNPKTKTIALWHMSINLLAVAAYALRQWLAFVAYLCGRVSRSRQIDLVARRAHRAGASYLRPDDADVDPAGVSSAHGSEKTAEGIRKFAADIHKLEKFVASKIE